MARKRTHHKKHHTKRRRRSSGMAGIGKGSVTSILGIAAGAVAAQYVGNMLSAKVNPKIVAGGQIAVGVLLPKFMKNEMGKSIGQGFIATGSVNLLKDFGVLKGLSGFEDQYDYSISGGEELRVISGGDELSNIDEDITGDSMNGYGSSDLSVLSGTGDDDPSHLDYM